MHTRNANYDLNTFFGSRTFSSLGGLFPKYEVSEGVAHLMTTAQASWFVTDCVAFHSVKCKPQDGLIICQLVCDPRMSGGDKRQDGFLMITDGDYNVLHKQTYDSVNLEDGKYEIWIQFNGDGFTVYLPSEH